MIHRTQLVDPFDGDGGGTRTEDVRTHAIEERREIGDLGLARCVVDDGGALGERRGHEHVLGGGDAREVEDDARAEQLLGPRDDEPALGLDVRAEVGERSQMDIDGT